MFYMTLFFSYITITRSKAATSVSQYGVTWNFSKDMQVGQFISGDWWVVGPVIITHITPATINDQNGTMINPKYAALNLVATQGWDSRIQGNFYKSSLNIAKFLPYTVENESTVMSCKSLIPNAIGNNPQMETIAILTVLSITPDVGSFRPPYIGGNKLLKWNKSDIDYARLKNLDHVSNMISFTESEGQFERTLISLTDTWNGTYLHPIRHDSPGYGREISHKIGRALLLLNLKYSNLEKEKLLIRIIQRGIDIYGISVSGGGWAGNGGHNSGRKLPMMIAGLVLNSKLILARANNYFAEDQQHFYITQEDVDLPRKIADVTRPQDPYTYEMVGIAEWCSNHIKDPAGAGSNWGVYYRNVVGPANVGMALAARISGLKNIWNCPAFFDYIDRFYNIEKYNTSIATNSIHPFVYSMWNVYRDKIFSDIIFPPTINTVFQIGDRVKMLRNTYIRDYGSFSGNLLGMQLLGSIGKIISGPVDNNNTIWWQINYDNGISGWSDENNYSKLTISVPSAPTGLKLNPK